MELSLFIDFGSTFTKVTVIDLEAEEIKATALSATTVNTDLMLGLEKALHDIYIQLGYEPQFKHKVACSSAAGGLKMIAIGLVRELTAEAAKRAALGAGAKVMEVFDYEITAVELAKISDFNPDIILLAGGTNGGNKEVLVHNAKMLCQLAPKIPIIIAGNKSVAPDAARILKENKFEAAVVENVMPEINKLNVEPARMKIREIFLQKIIEAKGFQQIQKYIDGILMPTPAAVLAAAQLLAKGADGQPGWGDLMVVDPGGATTDVHSIGSGAPRKAGVVLRGLPEPEIKRTVEGDLGMRCSAKALYDAVENRFPEYGVKNLKALKDYGEYLFTHTDFLPASKEEQFLETTMGMAAVEIAVERHAGHVEFVYTPFGATTLQYGKDLTGIKHVIGTGGILVNNPDSAAILKKALYSGKNPNILKPKAPQLWLDQHYIISALGLLAGIDSGKAYRMLNKYLVKLGRNHLGTKKQKMA